MWSLVLLQNSRWKPDILSLPAKNCIASGLQTCESGVYSSIGDAHRYGVLPFQVRPNLPRRGYRVYRKHCQTPIYYTN